MSRTRLSFGLLALAVAAAGAFTITFDPALPPAGTEITALRTAESRHYANGDGTVTSVIDASGPGPSAGADAAASLLATYTGYSELGYVYGSLQDSNRGVGGIFYAGYYDLSGLITDYERGWVEWNIASIPDTATITSVRCSTYCYSTTGTVTSLTFYHMANRPSVTPGVSLLYADAGSGTAYRTRPNPTAGWLVDSLSGQAAADLQGRLAANWFALGYTGAGSGSTWEIGFNGTGTTSGPPRLIVTWGATAAPDPGVARILAPTGTIDSTQSVAPACSVTNYGSAAAASFLVRCRVGASYSDTSRAPALAAGASALVVFPARASWPRGRWAVACSTELPGDANPANNRRVDSVTVRVLDALPLAIVAPSGAVDSGTALVPQVTVRNASNVAALVPLRLAIGAWSDSAAALLDPDSSATVGFAQWTAPARGQYAVACATLLSGDLVPANDTLSSAVTVEVTDAACVALLAPAGTVDPGPVVPRATVRNLGTTRTATTVTFAINSTPPYSEQLSLPAGLPAAETTLQFPAWDATAGTYACRCSVAASGDLVPANDTLSAGFRVRATALPPGWLELASVPLTPSGRAVKDGGWIAWDALTARFYGAKAYKTGDFHSYDAGAGAWTELAPWPLGVEAKPPYKGSAGCSDGNGTVYAVKGNNTTGFWKYVDSAWTQLADVPLGLSNKKVKGGTDLAYVTIGDSSYVYLLKGYKTEFFRFNVAAGTWQTLADAPAGAKPKWDKGSWLVYDEARGRLLAHKAKYQELYTYDLSAGTWGALLPGMPLANTQTGKSKKAKDGSDAAVLDGDVYALKGGNTIDFYSFDPAAGTWAERETIPSLGTPGKKKRVKGGGSIAADGEALYALKGNKTREFWRYVPSTLYAGRNSQHVRTDVQGVGREASGVMLFSQNPSRGSATLRWSAPSTPAPCPSTLSLYDASGRLVLSRAIDNRHSSFDIALNPGVYLLRVSGGVDLTRKLVIE